MTPEARMTALRQRAETALASARSELRTNPRALIGASALALLAAAALALQILSAADAARAETAALERDARLSQRLARLDSAPYREAAEAALERRAALQSRYWPGDSAAVAEAALQEHVLRLAEAAGVQGMRVTGAQTTPLPETTVSRIAVALDARGQAAPSLEQAQAFLAELKAGPAALEIAELDLAFGQRAGMRVVVRALYKPGAAPDGSGETAS